MFSRDCSQGNELRLAHIVETVQCVSLLLLMASLMACESGMVSLPFKSIHAWLVQTQCH